MQAVEITGHVVIRRRGVERIRHGHVWIYRSDVVNADAELGAVVNVRDERGNTVGIAFYSSTSQIALRFLRRGGAALPPNQIRDRLISGSAWRERLGIDPYFS